MLLDVVADLASSSFLLLLALVGEMMDDNLTLPHSPKLEDVRSLHGFGGNLAIYYACFSRYLVMSRARVRGVEWLPPRNRA